MEHLTVSELHSPSIYETIQSEQYETEYMEHLTVSECNSPPIYEAIQSEQYEAEYMETNEIFTVSELHSSPIYETIQIEQDEIEYMETNEIFTVVFTMEAIEVIKRFSECMEQHVPFRNLIDRLNTIVLPELERIFEQKLAMYISLNLNNKIRRNKEEIYIVTIEDVTREITNLVHRVLNICVQLIPGEGTINNMIDGYPLFILSKACNTNMLNAHVMGESMRRLILLMIQNHH